MDQLHKIIKYLQGNLTNEESNALNAWRSASPDNEALFESVREIYSVEHLEDIQLFDPLEKWTEIDDQIQEEKPKGKIIHLKWTAIAASLFILVAVAFWVLWPEPLYKEIVTANNTTKIELPDKSLVELGPNSKMKYFTRISKKVKERMIYLDGNARIEVSKNDQLPFIVVSGKTGTRVLGTIFEIRQLDSIQTVVSNIEGLIKFFELANEKNSVIVNEGESYSYDGKGFTNVTPVEPALIPEPIPPAIVEKKEPEPVIIEPPVVEEKPVELPPPPKEEPPVDKTVYTTIANIIDELNTRYAGKFNTAPWGQFRFNAKIPIDLTKYPDHSLEEFLKELGSVAKVEYRQTCPDCFELLTLTPK
ncbi:MAG TPA: FecR family protein [Saprospiraceae bacterium]|nr:hypothetical protein [Saprospirales bacterium]HRQ30569.1 FecR family protein [Saprospiraceae bacterium]